MNGNLGIPEIREFIGSLTRELNFSLDNYLEEEDTFSRHYKANEEFCQASVRYRLTNEWHKSCLRVIKEGKVEELREVVATINSRIESFIEELADNTTVVPSYEKDTFLYFRRVPYDFGIDISIYERNKEAERKREEAEMEAWRNLPEYEKEDTWRPGDAPWDAPGMSIHDFI